MSSYSDWAKGIEDQAYATPSRQGAYDGEGWDYILGQRSGMPADLTPTREEQVAAGSVAAAVRLREQQAAES
jgi:hypothetical protein